MITKKIEIKDENHLKEVVKALESIGERVIDPPSNYEIKSLWYDDSLDDIFDDRIWCISWKSIHSEDWTYCKDVPEFEIIAKTSYKLKEVPKIKITCKNCGKTIEYKNSNDVFKDFVIFKGSIDFGHKSLSVSEYEHICKDCITSLIDNWN